MSTPTEGAVASGLALRTANTSGLDTVDTCRMRLLSLRTRIETTWPTPRRRRTRFSRGHDIDGQARATIAELLQGLPTPLPLHPGADPEPINCDADEDLRHVPGRAVDAGLALLVDSTLDTIYPHQVTMLQSRQPVARGSIVVSGPTVGLIVATIIGTLDAVSEVLGAFVRGEPAPEAATVEYENPDLESALDKASHEPRPERARRVPRI